MHVSKVVSRRGEKEYVSWLVRRSFRDGDKVRHETLANLSALPPATIEAVRASLSGKTLVAAGDGLRTVRSLPHGQVAAVWAQAKALGLPGLLGPAGRSRDLAMALIVSRVVAPAPKLATTTTTVTITNEGRKAVRPSTKTPFAVVYVRRRYPSRDWLGRLLHSRDATHD